MPKTPQPIADRLWQRVDRTDGCWNWTGPTSNGYGVIGVGHRGSGLIRTHRLAYELITGPIPNGLHIDHLCRNRRCCNPDHLEPVTQQENNRRAGAARTHCPRGHELPPQPATPGARRTQCRTCKSEYDRRRYAARKAA